ncbi:hypothetical protein SBRCBS47491_008752 [Sporothrix bragantina]|uniref:Major facilitator superfamily (MFS) profile domain-containing protein n=1 Tax=Sporothrix bragantina TaxID=671064 RepID=A0ABP0CP13_9PEZI
MPTKERRHPHGSNARHRARLAEAENTEVTDEVTPLLTSLPDATSYGSSSSVTDSGSSNDGTETPTAADGAEPEVTINVSVAAILSVLLVGVFVSQADTSLVLATYGAIASEFHDLADASWLLSSYMLAMCVGHALYGKLSDIFGRKAMLQVAYALFFLGCVLCGVGQSLGQLIAARVVQGLGGAGMVVLVSILITDLVPLREVAAYRSYVNIVQTVGRSCGGAVGGFLAQSIGWRWAFLVQAPLTALAMVLVAWKLQPTKTRGASKFVSESCMSLSHKLKRVDMAGAALLSATVLSFLLALDMGGNGKVSWTSPILAVLFLLSHLTAAGFVWVERSWAQEPIFPLHLLRHYDVVTSYLILFFQNASQTSLMLFIPLYFQVTQNATPAQAGAYMIPSIAGNTVGGLMTGAFIKRCGRYKLPTILSSLSAGLCFTMLLIFWHGSPETPLWQCLFVFLGGFGTAAAHSAVFVGLAAGVAEDEMAVAGSGLYLSGNIGAVAGMSAASALFQAMLRSGLTQRVAENADLGLNPETAAEIIRQALSDIGYVQGLVGRVRDAVVAAYVSSFASAFWMNLGFASVCLVVSLMIRERRL